MLSHGRKHGSGGQSLGGVTQTQPDHFVELLPVIRDIDPTVHSISFGKLEEATVLGAHDLDACSEGQQHSS